MRARRPFAARWKSARRFRRLTLGCSLSSRLMKALTQASGSFIASLPRDQGLSRAARAGSGGKTLAAARPTRVENLAASDGFHAGAKTVATLANDLARLVGPLHCQISKRRLNLKDDRLF
jgi:hypothetical protein